MMWLKFWCKYVWAWLVEKVIRPRWICMSDSDSDTNELGVRILGVNFVYYKYPDPSADKLGEYSWRFAVKREFGTTIYSLAEEEIEAEFDEVV